MTSTGGQPTAQSSKTQEPLWSFVVWTLGFSTLLPLVMLGVVSSFRESSVRDALSLAFKGGEFFLASSVLLGCALGAFLDGADSRTYLSRHGYTLAMICGYSLCLVSWLLISQESNPDRYGADITVGVGASALIMSSALSLRALRDG